MPEPQPLWSYKKPKDEETDSVPGTPKIEKDSTPNFNFKFDPEKIVVEGKERTIEMQGSGLYVFDKQEKFDRPIPTLPVVEKAGVWIGFKKPMSDGNVLVPVASKPSDFKTVKIRGQTIKSILNLTKKTK